MDFCFQRRDDTAKSYYTVRLPYQQVKETDDVRPLMLGLAAKRLEIPVPGEATGGFSPWETFGEQDG